MSVSSVERFYLLDNVNTCVDLLIDNTRVPLTYPPILPGG